MQVLISLRLLLRVHAAISVLLVLSLASIAVLSFGDASHESEVVATDEHTTGASDSSSPTPRMTNQSNWAEHEQDESTPQALDRKDENKSVAMAEQYYYTSVESESLAEHDRNESESLAERDSVESPSLAEHDSVESPSLAEHDSVESPSLAEHDRNESESLAEHDRNELESLAEHDSVESVSTEHNKDESESLVVRIHAHPYTMVALWLVAASSVVAWCLVGAMALYIWKSDQTHLELPKGITLSPDEIVAHADILRSQGIVDLASDKKPPLSKSSHHTEIEADIFNDKRAVYVFDGYSTEDIYVVVEIRGCEKGPPLLPTRSSDTGERWTSPEDRYQPFANYLVQCMWLLHEENWSDRILQHIKGNNLVRYQAAVRETEWRKLWEALLKPFAEQRTVYRGVHKCRKAPDIFFGVNARFVHKDDVTSDESQEHRHGNTLPLGDPVGDSKDGIPLPTAVEWLEFWSHQAIPQRRTFIEFASSLGNLPAPPRSNSFPDLRGGANLNDA